MAPIGGPRSGIVGSGSAIPDSAMWRTVRDEGSGTTAADSIGSADLSLNGASWVADGNAQGGYKLSYDGTDDDATATLPVDTYSQVLWCFTVETTGTAQILGGWDESGSFGLRLADMDTASTTGALNWRVGDGSSLVDVESTSTIDDGSKYRIGLAVDENNETYVAVNSTIENTTTFGTSGPVSNSYTEGRNPSTTSAWADADIDDGVLYTDVSQQTLDDDYALQPWS